MKWGRKHLKIGIFGGTFHPPHLGHLGAMEAAIAKLSLDLLYVIPTNIPPHKTMVSSEVTAKARYEMTRILCQNLDKTVVSDLEIKRQGASYTIDTAKTIQEKHPGAQLYLLMGTDMLCCLEEWKDAFELCKLVTPVVFMRGEERDEHLEECILQTKANLSTEVLLIEHPVFPISSTQIREILCKRKGLEYVGEQVYGHIVKKAYYGVKPEFPWLWEKVAEILPQKRMAHIKGTEEEAIKLANHWGADEKEARMAAILHDVTKYFTKAEHLFIFQRYAMMKEKSGNLPLEEEIGAEKLLHAKTGALLAKMDFAASKEVCEAISYHTTGRKDMSLLEKVIYLADYIEPNREFPQLATLRKLAYENLDQALFFALNLGVRELEEKGLPPHPDTMEAILFLKENGELELPY